MTGRDVLEIHARTWKPTGLTILDVPLILKHTGLAIKNAVQFYEKEDTNAAVQSLLDNIAFSADIIAMIGKDPRRKEKR